MKRTFLPILAVLLIAGGFGPGAKADELDYDLESAEHVNLSQEIQQMRETLFAMQETLAAMQHSGGGYCDAGCGGCGCCDGCGSCGYCECCGCDPCCCLPCGWDFGAEVAFLRPFFGRGGTADAFVQNTVANNPNTLLTLGVDPPEYNYEATPRFWIGFMGCQDFGWRLRYWRFDHDSKVVDLSIPDVNDPNEVERERASESLEMDVLDVEITAQTQLCRWCLLGSAGVRHAKIDRLTMREDFFDSSGMLERVEDDFSIEG